ncbi:Rv3654c family TadE-like protein [Streptomyces sp. NPDC020406]|uniref:Rv3654c family TadE-like protein n=1 Tax=unclassified Streptomyces TaxID=2593676 RepID=UPI00379305FA
MRAAAEGPAGGDRGLATVWVAVTTATLCAVFATVLALGQAVAARHKAGGAADLAALAAADRALSGSAAACEVAGDVAAAQGAELVRCAVEGEVADVTARARFGPYAPEVRSRAGPPAVVSSATPAPDDAAHVPRLSSGETSSVPRRAPVHAQTALGGPRYVVCHMRCPAGAGGAGAVSAAAR